jgi:hypothetical protein
MATVPVVLTAVALSGEITSGPYAAIFAPYIPAHNDDAISTLLNDKTAIAAGTVPHAPIQSADFLAAIVPLDLQTLTTGQKQELGLLTSPEFINVGDKNIQNWVIDTFPTANAPTTNSALTAMAMQVASRAEVLFGRGTTITDIMVNWALRNTGTNPFPS